MPPSNLKGAPNGDEDGEVLSARERVLSSMPDAAVLICDHVIMTNHLDGSNHLSHASLVVGSPEMGGTLLLPQGRVGLCSPNLEGVDTIIVLSGSNQGIATAGEGRRMAAVPRGDDGGDGALNSGAPAVHGLQSTCNANYVF
ncbi:hypothetical protein ACLOJK_027835 [Asimina triloba]